jgi:hypothetical protein
VGAMNSTTRDRVYSASRGPAWRLDSKPRRAERLRLADLNDRRLEACARLFDENRERRDVEATEPRTPAGIVSRPNG